MVHLLDLTQMNQTDDRQRSSDKSLVHRSTLKSDGRTADPGRTTRQSGPC